MLHPTDEQRQALDLFASGKSLVIEAGAGTGKTTTLKLLASSTPRRGQYLAFNKAIVTESSAKMPATVRCNTAHGLAFQAIGHRYKHRLNASRQHGSEIARKLGNRAMTVDVGGNSRTLTASYLAGRVMLSIEQFCKTADAIPDRSHVPPIAGLDEEMNHHVAIHLESFLEKAWDDLLDLKGTLRFQHDHYLKAWQLSSPKIDADFILFDEAQDANPVMSAIVEAQRQSQLIFVGDSQQQIYSFTGAVNALASLQTDHRIYLTQSFRFGPAIAKAANLLLAQLKAGLRLKGLSSIASDTCVITQPDAILTRTNARSIVCLIDQQTSGRQVHLVGEGKEVLSFARAVQDLKLGRTVEHPDLAMFKTWREVVEYAEHDQLGGDLALNVRLVEEFGVPAILKALEALVPADEADLVISTAHKSKGREWDRVQLAPDFMHKNQDDEIAEPDPEELRLLYVAVTRAKLQLDVTSVSPLIYGDET